MQIKILALCGSSRRDSLNQKLLDIAALGAVDAGAKLGGVGWHSLIHQIFVHDGRVWSSAGVTTGIDLALALIAEPTAWRWSRIQWAP